MGIARNSLPHKVPSDVLDWRDRAYYPRGQVSNERWAWEFLRRRVDYRSDFARWISLDARERAFGLATVGGEPLPELHKRYGLLWCLGFFPDPDKPNARVVFSATTTTFSVRFPELENDPFQIPALAPDRPSKIVIEFDSELPVKPQLARAESLIAHWRRQVGKRGPEKRMNPSLYLPYLQILDGRASGNSNEDIANALSPSGRQGPRWVNDSYRKALVILDRPSSIAHSTPKP